MGTTVQVVATGEPEAIRRVVEDSLAAIDRLEHRWSRFLPCSELSRLNASTDGAPTAASAETVTLIDRGIEGWHRTGGLFDPSVLQAVVAAGYDRDFDALTTEGSRPDTASGEPTSRTTAGRPPGDTVVVGELFDGGCERMVVDVEGGRVTLPAGVGFDPGGLGKGLAADLVAESGIRRPGVAGILVNLGGDLRCLGRPPADGDGAWVIGLPPSADEPGEPGGGPRATVRLAEGAAATSTCRRRRWSTAAGPAHHLIDPATRRPSGRAAASVTVLAATACDAEIVATAVAANGGLPADRRMLGDAVVLVDRADGGHEVHGPLDRYRP